MTNEQKQVPTFTDKNVPPSGSLPKNTQPLLYGGLAVVMVIVIWFSGHTNPSSHTSTNRPAEPAIQPPSEDRLNDYRKQIEKATEKLNEEQNDLVRQKALLDKAASQNPGGPLPEGYATAAPAGSSLQAASAAPPGSIAEEQAKREYASRFASNMVLTYRSDPKSGGSDAALPPIQAPPAIDPRFYAALMSPPPTPAVQAVSEIAAQNQKPAEATAQTPKPSLPDLNRASGRDYRLFEGTILETVLINRLDGTFSGPVICMVSYNVYSHDHNHLLIPSGSRVLGDVHPVDSSGQSRLAVTFHRLIMPDGYTVDLDQFRGLDQVGETGLRDQVNHHYLQIFGASIAIGLIAGLAENNTQYGVSVPATDVYRQGVANSLAQSSTHILDRFLNILPTFTIREGQRIKIYLQQDLALPAYENHEMPADI
jgi:type IV secretion system protein VirB10